MRLILVLHSFRMHKHGRARSWKSRKRYNSDSRDMFGFREWLYRLPTRRGS